MTEVFKKLSKRELRFTIILLTIILLYGIYVVIFVPSITKLEEKDNELLKLEQKEIQLNNEIVLYNKLKDTYQSYNFEKLQIQFPNEGKVPKIILWIEELFQDSNLSRPSVSLSKEGQYLQISLSFTGPYTDVQSLINKIEANERLTTIETINLNASTVDSITVNLVIRIYGQDFTDVSKNEYDFNHVDLFKIE